MFEDYSFPAALIVIAIVAGFVFNSYDKRHTKSDLQTKIVQACATAPDNQLSACVQRITETVNGVK